MEYKVNLFYNYHSIGDVLIAIIDNKKFPTFYKKEGDIVFIYSNSSLIGINFFNISTICKVKSNGSIHRPPKLLIDVLNSLIPKNYGIKIFVDSDSLFRIAKILEIKESGLNNYELICDVNKVVRIKCISKEKPLLNVKILIALNGAMLANGNEVETLTGYDGIACSSKDIGDLSSQDEIVYVEANANVGDDFFQMKGSN